jgi:two-component system LytT family response regulator
MSAVRVLVVDDEKPARERLRRLLERDNRVQVIDCCVGGADALRRMREAARAGAPVQLLFLDVQMPELDGFDLVAALLDRELDRVDAGDMPAIVFVTAHDEYAIRAFDAHAIDYLLKPFSDERFEAALDRAVRHLRAGHAQALLSRMQALLGHGTGEPAPGDADGGADSGPDRGAVGGGRVNAGVNSAATLDRILLKGTDRIRLLPVQQITWIEAAGMYVKLHMRDGAQHLHRSLLGELDDALDKRRFIRVHRSAIVNIDVIEELRQDAHGDYTVVLKDRTEVRLGRRYRARLQDRLGQDL